MTENNQECQGQIAYMRLWGDLQMQLMLIAAALFHSDS